MTNTAGHPAGMSVGQEDAVPAGLAAANVPPMASTAAASKPAPSAEESRKRAKLKRGSSTFTTYTNDSPPGDDESDDDDGNGRDLDDKRAGRRKIEIRYIEDKSRRHITFSKRKAGIMKKAYELSTLTGTQVLLLVASETGHVYTFATPKLQPLITKQEGKNLIQTCLNAPDALPDYASMSGGSGGGSAYPAHQLEDNAHGKSIYDSNSQAAAAAYYAAAYAQPSVASAASAAAQAFYSPPYGSAPQFGAPLGAGYWAAPAGDNSALSPQDDPTAQPVNASSSSSLRRQSPRHQHYGGSDHLQ